VTAAGSSIHSGNPLLDAQDRLPCADATLCARPVVRPVADVRPFYVQTRARGAGRDDRPRRSLKVTTVTATAT